MSVADTLAPVFTILIIFNALNVALPLIRHRFFLYILAFILFGISLLLLLMGIIFILSDASVSIYTLNTKKQVKSQTEVPFDFLLFFQLNLTMTTVMTSSVVAMICWMFHQSQKAWQVYILPMLNDINLLEKSCWANTLDLRNRKAPSEL